MTMPDMKPPRNYQLKNGDAARRFFDALNLHRTVLTMDEILAHRFLAVRLSDGGTDNTVYESRAAAIHANRNAPSRIFTFPVPLERLSLQACDALLTYVRGCYDAGTREDPRHQLIIPTRLENLETLT